MHFPSIAKSHAFLDTIHRLDHHKLVTIFLVILVSGTPIGDLGLDYLRGSRRSQGNEMQLLRQAATAMKSSLSQSIEHTIFQEKRR